MADRRCVILFPSFFPGVLSVDGGDEEEGVRGQNDGGCEVNGTRLNISFCLSLSKLCLLTPPVFHTHFPSHVMFLYVVYNNGAASSVNYLHSNSLIHSYLPVLSSPLSLWNSIYVLSVWNVQQFLKCPGRWSAYPTTTLSIFISVLPLHNHF